MAMMMFKGAIDYSQVRVHKRRYLPGSGSNAMTPHGEIYFPAFAYQDDFSVQDKYKQVWFMHEMTHVWQYQLGYGVKQAGFKIMLKGGYFKNKNHARPLAYQHSPHGDQNQQMSDFNMEQQADIISRFHGSIHLDMTDYSESLAFDACILREFLENPNNKKLLPTTLHF
jgi:hypothetical protein